MTERELQDWVVVAARLLGWRVAHFRPAGRRRAGAQPVPTTPRASLISFSSETASSSPNQGRSWSPSSRTGRLARGAPRGRCRGGRLDGQGLDVGGCRGSAPIRKGAGPRERSPPRREGDRRAARRPESWVRESAGSGAIPHVRLGGMSASTWPMSSAGSRSASNRADRSRSESEGRAVRRTRQAFPCGPPGGVA